MNEKYHSKIKLRLIRQYLFMCSTIKSDPEKFTYFETHAGDGLAEFEDGTVEDGSAFLAAKNEKKFPCIFMEMDEKNVENLKNLMSEDDFPQVTILRGNSNDEIEQLLSNVPSYYHTVGFLDPWGPNDLKWRTVVRIANHSYIYTNSGDIRRPELLINFPIMGIKRNAGFLNKGAQNDKKNQYCKINDNFFGTNKWRDIWRKYQDSSAESREKLMELYLDRLKPFYEYSNPLILVEDIKKNSALYYIISCTNSPLGEKFLQDLKQRIERWKKEDFIRDILKISMPLEKFDRKFEMPRLDSYD